MPDTSDVNQGKETRRHHGEDRHRLRGAVDRLPPRGSEEEENRRDQRSGVRDTDPEDEGRDVHAPAHRRHEPADSDPLVDLPEPGGQEEPDTGHTHPEERPPPLTGYSEHLEDIAVDVIETMDVRVGQRTAFGRSNGHDQCPPETSWKVTFFK